MKPMGEKSSKRIPNNEWHRKRTRVELEERSVMMRDNTKLKPKLLG